jgi:hypothetical protein
MDRPGARRGCAVTPAGPAVLVLPGSGKPFDQFQADSGSAAGAAGLGAVLGAAAGAAIGAATGNPAAGAAIGAGGGLVTGGALGLAAAQRSGGEVPHRYDTAYVQCMYGRGNRVPVSGPLAAPTIPGPPPPPPG